MFSRSFPTSAQYALGVKIGHAVVEAQRAGATCDEVIATLRHSIVLVETNRDFAQVESGLRHG